MALWVQLVNTVRIAVETTSGSVNPAAFLAGNSSRIFGWKPIPAPDYCQLLEHPRA